MNFMRLATLYPEHPDFQVATDKLLKEALAARQHCLRHWAGGACKLTGSESILVSQKGAHGKTKNAKFTAASCFNFNLAD